MFVKKAYSAFATCADFLSALFADYPIFFESYETNETNHTLAVKGKGIGLRAKDAQSSIYFVDVLQNEKAVSQKFWNNEIEAYNTGTELFIWSNVIPVSGVSNSKACIIISIKDVPFIATNMGSTTSSRGCIMVYSDNSKTPISFSYFNSVPSNYMSLATLTDFSSDVICKPCFINAQNSLDFSEKAVKYTMNGNYYIGVAELSMQYKP